MGIIIFIIITSVLVIGHHLYKNYRVFSSRVSFQHSLDLTNLPIITAYTEYGKLNLLLDTGSTDCIINSNVLQSKYPNLQLSEYGECITANGNVPINGTVSINLTVQNKQLNSEFIILKLDEQFDIIKKEEGVTIHGILGVNFFEKYKYIIDFNSNSFYMK